ncbi:hypothetical protein, partial [Dickeya oryzae]
MYSTKKTRPKARFKLLTNTLIIGEWVFLASQTVLRWTTSPGEPAGRGESPCRAGQKREKRF